jgi:hypothetical protein
MISANALSRSRIRSVGPSTLHCKVYGCEGRIQGGSGAGIG